MRKFFNGRTNNYIYIEKSKIVTLLGGGVQRLSSNINMIPSGRIQIQEKGIIPRRKKEARGGHGNRFDKRRWKGGQSSKPVRGTSLE